MRRLFITSTMIITALACSSEGLDVGSNGVNTASGGTGGTGGTGYSGPAVLPTLPNPNDCVIGPQLGIVGKWDGYVEGGSNLHVVINGASAEHGVCGTVMYGEGTPPPPPTDPDVGYPPASYGYPPGLWSGPYFEGPNITGPDPGYTYTMLDGTVETSRVRFSTSNRELWKEWCAMQTPVPGTGTCIPNFSSAGTDSSGCWIQNPPSERVYIDCGKLTLCKYGSGVCVCNDSGCVSSMGASVSFDLYFQGDYADGSIGGSSRVRLFRAQP